jgi:hypothetical protein
VLGVVGCGVLIRMGTVPVCNKGQERSVVGCIEGVGVLGSEVTSKQSDVLACLFG